MSVLIWIQPFDTLIVFLKEFFEKVSFEKSLQTTKQQNHDYLPSMQVSLPVSVFFGHLKVLNVMQAIEM